jgi:hypothetical protein
VGEAVGVSAVDDLVVEVVEVLPAPPEQAWDLLTEAADLAANMRTVLRAAAALL